VDFIPLKTRQRATRPRRRRRAFGTTTGTINIEATFGTANTGATGAPQPTNETPPPPYAPPPTGYAAPLPVNPTNPTPPPSYPTPLLNDNHQPLL